MEARRSMAREMHMYHQEGSTYGFRQQIGCGRDRTRFFSLEDTDNDVRALCAAALRMCGENAIEAAADLSVRETNSYGMPLPVAPDALLHDIAETRRVLDALRLARIDYGMAFKGHSLAAYALDCGTEHCGLVDDGKGTGGRLLAVRWKPNYVGAY